MQLHRAPIAALALLAVAACDDTRTEDDAGPRPDSGFERDAGPVEGVDAGSTDAGRMLDSGLLTDAGGTDGGGTDAGDTDAGGTDAGPETDGGLDPVGDTCESAVDVTAGGTFVGTTVGASDTYSVSGSGCPSGGIGSSYDVAYVVSPSVSTNYRVRVTAEAGLDLWVWASDDCAADGCTDFARNGDPLEIEFTADGTTPIFVVVEGELFNDAGRFALEVTPL